MRLQSGNRFRQRQHLDGLFKKNGKPALDHPGGDIAPCFAPACGIEIMVNALFGQPIHKDKKTRLSSQGKKNRDKITHPLKKRKGCLH
jgi:hypothetical protein